MDDLIKILAEKLELPQDKARIAVVLMCDYMKRKLPTAMFEDIDAILETPSVTEEEARELGLFKIP